MPTTSPEYAVGIMTMDVEGRDSGAFERLAARAVARFDAVLSGELGLRVELFAFEGPHLVPGAGAYAPLDFLEMGLAEKLERKIPFLLIVTEVDLSSATLAYALALPSQLANIGVVSTKRLDPGFWGDDPDSDRTADRLAALMLHTFGHLLNLDHSSDPANAMYPVEGVEDLDGMGTLTPDQLSRLRRTMPDEAHDTVASGTGRGARWAFIARVLVADSPSIARAVIRANPFRLATRLPTMIAAGLSVVIALLFGAETWEVASAVSLYEVAIFSAASISASAFVLYRAFAFEALVGRDGRLAESTVVTVSATLLSLGLTVVVLFVGFAVLVYGGVATVFPRRLMELWLSLDGAAPGLDVLKLSLFLAAMGVLAGSLGGRASSRDLVRCVLFLDEES